MSEVKVNKISPKTACGTLTVGDSGDTVSVPAGVPVTVTDTLTSGTVKSNTYQASDAGNIINQSGTTITIGASGDTVALACGASQTGFGGAGQLVDWQTTKKTAGFSAVSGEGYFCDTSGGVFAVALPAGSAGNIVGVADYGNDFDSNSLTITPNGSDKIKAGVAGDSIYLNTAGSSMTLLYVDATQGWIPIVDSAYTATGSDFIVATGGTITCSGNFKIHKFTGPGTFEITSGGGPAAVVDYVVVAGGGGGSRSQSGGGGAGGYRESPGAATCYTASPLGAAPATTIPFIPGPASVPITVGAGGTSPPGGCATDGNDSIFSTITSTGGGVGGSPSIPASGGPGGSGGGGSRHCATNTAGTGNSPPTSPAQGTSGATGDPNGAGGGGGATVAGASSPPKIGGTGTTSCITASPVAYAGGGGGGNAPPSPNGSPCGTGGSGGPPPHSPASAGVANTGAGGGGGGDAPPGLGGAGGSGIVIIRYKYQ